MWSSYAGARCLCSTTNTTHAKRTNVIGRCRNRRHTHTIYIQSERVVVCCSHGPAAGIKSHEAFGCALLPIGRRIDHRTRTEGISHLLKSKSSADERLNVTASLQLWSVHAWCVDASCQRCAGRNLQNHYFLSVINCRILRQFRSTARLRDSQCKLCVN